MISTDDIRIQLTADGSHTLMNTRLDESYHAHNGAMSESLHVYIQAGLEEAAKTKKKISILEFGFGTGLNAILTMKRAQELGLEIEYMSIEPMPIPEELVKQLNYCQHLPSEYEPLFGAMHGGDWGRDIAIKSDFILHKFKGKLLDLVVDKPKFDLVYFDAFAPNRQPDAWSLSHFTRCFETMVSGGLFVTYCANGQFKRDMKSIGFQVKAYPGALGRREMTRAWKP